MKRRKFISNLAIQTGAVAAGWSLLGCNTSTSAVKKDSKKLGIALVGLGGYATGQLAPALTQTEFCELRGIVTGTPSKIAKWVTKYNLPDTNVYNYENFDSIAENDAIDIVYVVLPNSMHAEYTIRALEAGKHVICEKPMATNYADCVRMLDAAKKANKSLSIGYRLHYEPHHLELMRIGQEKVYGKIKDINSGFGFELRDKTKWRLDKHMAGGGPLMDVGIYAIQNVIYSIGELPIAVKATDITLDKTFYGAVEGALDIELIFPSATPSKIRTSYEEYYNYSHAQLADGWWKLETAHSYGGLQGETHLGPMNIANINQQAAQMDDMARKIMNGEVSTTPGEMGARDMYIIDRVYQSAYSGSQDISLEGIPNILHLV